MIMCLYYLAAFTLKSTSQDMLLMLQLTVAMLDQIQLSLSLW